MKNITIIILEIFLNIACFAQSTQYLEEHTFDTPWPNNFQKTYIGKNWLKLAPNFSCTANSTTYAIFKIDEDHVCPNCFGDEGTTSEPTIAFNSGLPVGTTQGSVSVGATGAANYTIPVKIAPGTAGMEPKLSIVYSSQGGNGIMGMGWNIGGLSSITRTGHTVYHDGYCDEIKLTSDDNFILDGMRLLLAGSEYHSELESFSQIIPHDVDANGPAWFEVKLKDGLTYKYGSTASSKFLSGSNGTGPALTWLLDRVEDLHGNYMTFIYHIDYTLHEFWIERIDYTGNGSISPYNSIKFIYDQRWDPVYQYQAGTEIKNRVLLSKIKVLSENMLVREYQFNYFIGTYDTYHRLTEIVEKGADGSVFNSTTIIWNDYQSSQKFISNTTSGFSDTNMDLIYGDYNGDGKTDFIKLPRSSTGTMSYYQNTSNNTFSEMVSLALPSNYLKPSGMDYYFYHHFPSSFDFNGDGKEDFILCRKTVGTPNTYNYWIYSYNVDNNTIDENSHVFSTTDDNNQVSYGDFNGDGRLDIVLLERSTNHCKIFNSDANWNLTQVYSDYLPISGTTEIVSSDFNGDGKTDFMFLTSGQYRLYTLNTSGSSAVLESLTSSATNITWSSFYLGDFNGDGKTDLLVYNSLLSSNWGIMLSNGYNFSSAMSLPTNTIQGIDPSLNYPNPANENYNYFIADINSDGKDDIIEMYNDGTSHCNIIYSKGIGCSSGYCNPWLIKESNPSISFYVNSNFWNFRDINGDGFPDLVYYDYSSTPQVITIHADQQRNLAHKITDGLNNQYEFEYKTLANGANYSKLNNADFPVCDIQAPITVVNKTTVPDGIGGTVLTGYSYVGAKLHRQGKGFLGFNKITKSSTNGITIEDTYELKIPNDNSYCAGPLLFKEKTDFYTDNLTEVTNTNTVVPNTTNGKILFIKQDLVTDYHFEKGTTSITRTIDNSTGNLTAEDATYADGNTISTSYSNFQNIGTSALSKPGTITIDKTINANLFSVTSTFTWNSTNGQLENTTEHGITTEFEYDGFGNTTKKTIQGTSKIDNFYYDTKGRFVTKQVNALGQEMKMEYDPRFGVVTKSTDINMLVTNLVYDGFGRLIQKRLADGTTINYRIYWENGGSQPERLYSTLEQSTNNNPYIITTYDCFGRNVGTETQGFHDATLATEIHYNNIGQVVYKSKPNGESYTYIYAASYGKLSEVYTPTDILTYSYSGRTTTIHSSVGTKVTEENCLGMTTRVVDNNIEMLYSYEGHGGISQISSAIMDNYSTSATYYTGSKDGLQHTLTDPDAGTVTFDYNALRELVSQVDNKGNSTTDITYDVLGRILSKTTGGITYNYIYDTEHKGALSSITSTNNMAVYYKYNIFGDVIEKTERIEGQDYITKYSYNNNHLITKKTFPSGFAVTYNYDNFGYLEEIKKVNSNSIWLANSMNAMMQVTQYKSGDNITTSNTYNFDYLTSTNSVAGGNTIHNMGYTWYQEQGNLHTRTDWQDFTETFGYDGMQRCTTATLTDQTNAIISSLSMSYLANGNIQNKSDAGDFDYGDNAGPHALTKVSNYTSNFSLIPQYVTYNEFNKVATIDEDIYRMELTYGIAAERRKVVMKQNGSTLWTKYYAEDYEKTVTSNNTTRELHYIYSPSGLCAIYVKNSVNNTDTLYYVFSDHLGSITTIANESGNVLQRLHYDMWGKRSIDAGSASYIFDRGYTGHEHLNAFNLINMNGRVYDPVIGRFLSPDNFVQNSSSQAFNRYSYANNNPTSNTDITGNSWEPVVSGILDFFFMPAKAMSEAIMYANDQINGTPQSGGYFNSNYIFSNAAPYSSSDAGLAVAPGSPYHLGLNWRNDISESESSWVDYSWQDEYAEHFMFDRMYAMGATMGSSNYYPYSTFEGVNIIESKKIAKGSAFTVPGIGIFAHPSVSHDLGLLRHEFGHILQAKLWGNKTYFSRVGPTSVKSYRLSKYNHKNTWTEWSANKLSFDYLSQPVDWDMRYPISPDFKVAWPYGDMPNDLLLSFPYATIK